MAEREWQPIETAPRDCTRVLLAGPYDNAPGQWVVIGTCWRLAGQWTYDLPSQDPIPATPTHWMPLPDPPVAA